MDEALTIDSLPPRNPSLRVAVVTETFPPEINGVAQTIEQLARALQVRNHHVQIVRPRQRADDYDRDGARLGLEQVLTRGLPIPRYPQLRVGLPAKRALQSLWTVRRPDLVHIATEGPLGWSALRVARKLRLPLSTDFRTQFHAYSRHYGLGWMEKSILGYLRHFHNQADCTFVPTEALRAQLAGWGFERLCVAPRGVDAERFSPRWRSAALRAAWSASADARIVLYVGRLAAEKNLDLLVRAYEAMRAHDPAWRLVVVGDGPERGALQARCPTAVLTGALSGMALAEAYASADVFIFPSQTETFGNVVTEALASGVPVLAFDLAGAHTLVQSGRNGVLVPPGDERAFVRAAELLAREPHTVARLAQAARPSVLHLSWAHIAEHMEQHWLRLLAARQGAGMSFALAWHGRPASDG
ncbi:glycosyltransferase family 4 protein [Tepidimonas charontis]|uniref:GDP-mannose-dependent alpha-mannosyltransferase n=1 Tax=Tepidimonas charontis TaxID=2267262 RepID=A0A554XGU2_9BURK|nr:glycosyltransferase family 1 protein [Tepidimonas charontis]TSE35044.1 GDP-mannose-dependent alpha-mannosyltransferase [Tepidimonas charontis]